MRKLMIALAGATALTAASAANATVTLGSTGQIAGSSTSVTSSITNNASVPNTIAFLTSNAAAGTDTSFIDFIESYASTGVFSVTTATLPSSSVTLFNVLTGVAVGTAEPTSFTTNVPGGTATGTSYSLNLTTNLDANTWYRFVYTTNMATVGDVSGTANFYTRAVPEPATWALMLLGFGGMGFVLRRRRRPVLAQVA
jgi:hypothetical protein